MVAMWQTAMADGGRRQTTMADWQMVDGIEFKRSNLDDDVMIRKEAERATFVVEKAEQDKRSVIIRTHVKLLHIFVSIHVTSIVAYEMDELDSGVVSNPDFLNARVIDRGELKMCLCNDLDLKGLSGFRNLQLMVILTGSYDGIKAIEQCCQMMEDLTLCDHRLEDGYVVFRV
ncbi:hypothetical protein Tco_1011115 [Tanacetum coccineum]